MSWVFFVYHTLLITANVYSCEVMKDVTTIVPFFFFLRNSLEIHVIALLLIYICVVVTVMWPRDQQRPQRVSSWSVLCISVNFISCLFELHNSHLVHRITVLTATANIHCLSFKGPLQSQHTFSIFTVHILYRYSLLIMRFRSAEEQIVVPSDSARLLLIWAEWDRINFFI